MKTLAACALALSGSAQAQSSPDAPKWPPQVAPVMPNMFTADTTGFYNGTTVHQTLRSTWYYDWPRARSRMDYEVTTDGKTSKYTELWNAGEQKFYHFNSTGCVSFDYPLGFLRPDCFEHAMLTDPYSAKNPEGGRYLGRQMVDKRWADLFAYGPSGSGQFNMAHDIETNLPLYDHGPADGTGAIGGNHWFNWKVGKVPDTTYSSLDTSKCTKETELPLVRMPTVSLAVMQAVEKVRETKLV